MKVRALAIVLSLSAAACAAGAGPSVSIGLLPESRQAGLVTLGQVARVTSEDLALLQQVVHLPVAVVTRRGPVRLSRHAVEARVARALRLHDADVAWTGAAGTTISPAPLAAEEGRRAPSPSARGAEASRAPLVARGQWASLRSVDGAVSVHTRAEVLQDGWPGDKVRVRSPSPGPSLLATVVGPGELELRK